MFFIEILALRARTLSLGVEMKYFFWTSVCFLVMWGALNLLGLLKYQKMWVKSLWEQDSISKNPSVSQKWSTAKPGATQLPVSPANHHPPGQDHALLGSPFFDQTAETWKAISTDSLPTGICLNSGNVPRWLLQSWWINFTDSCLYELTLLWLISWIFYRISLLREWDAENYLT